MNAQNEKIAHDVSITARRHMDISGVKEVISFDDSSIVLLTVCGEMNIEGSGIKIAVLDTDRGIVTLDGRIDSVWYAEERGKEKRGLFGKVFS